MKGLPYAARPGAGFVILTLACAASLGFFVWGASTPPLDTVWRVQTELMVGRREALAGWERRELEEALVRHPAIAAEMLDDAPGGLISANAGGLTETGYAYLVRRSAEASDRIEVAPGGATDAPSVQVTVRVGGREQRGLAARERPFAMRLPDGPYPQLVEVRVARVAHGKRKRRPPAAVVRLGGA